MNANFPTYSPSEGDKTSLKAERGPDGALKVDDARRRVRRPRLPQIGDFRARKPTPKARPRIIDFDLDLKLGAVAGFYGEALRSVDVKMSRRNGTIRSFTLSGKLGRDTPLTGGFARPSRAGPRRDLSRDQRCRRILPLHRHLCQDGRRPACAGDGSADRRTARQRRPDQRPRFLHQGRGVARSGRRRRPDRAPGTASRSRGCAPNSPGRTASSRSAKAS